MKTPSRSPILAAAAVFLISTGALAKAPPKAEDKPIPAVPAEVIKKGGDAVLDWMLDSGYLTPEYLRKFIGEKAHAATAEGVDKDPLLVKLRSGYESLPATAFKVGAKPIWEKVAAKLTPDVLAKVNGLENPKIYGVNGNGELLIGDGGIDVPCFTLRHNYFQTRRKAHASGLALMTKEEFRSFNNGSMAMNTWTWLESGDAPALALDGCWDGYAYVGENDPEFSNVGGGVQRVLRVKF